MTVNDIKPSCSVIPEEFATGTSKIYFFQYFSTISRET